MRKRPAEKSLIYFLVFFVTSCITINIYFPAAAVEKAADKIVDEVWGDQTTEPQKEDEQKKKEEHQSRTEQTMTLVLSLIGPRAASAAEADINITTPAIRALKDSIQQRADSIIPYMDSGNAGLSNDGLLVIRSSSGLNLKDKAALNRLVDAENRDRNALYAEIAKANNFPPERVSDIKKIFAESWIRKARSGWWIQDAGGQWKQK